MNNHIYKSIMIVFLILFFTIVLFYSLQINIFEENWMANVIPIGKGPNIDITLFYKNNRITNSNFSITYLFIIIFYYVITSLIGYIFWRIIIDNQTFSYFLKQSKFEHPSDYPFSLLLFSSFTVGYLITIAINRIITLLFIHKFAGIIIISLYFSIFLLVVSNYLRKNNGFFELFNVKKYSLTILLGILTTFLIINQIQIGEFYVVGDAVIRVFNNLFSGVLSQDHFPIISHHYDEPLFLYPLLSIDQFFVKENSKLLPYLIFYPLCKISIFSLIIVLTKKYLSNYTECIIVSLFIMIGSHFMHPLLYRTIFDSLNPPLWSLHFSRILCSILSLFLIQIFTFGNIGNSLNKRLINILLLLFGIGLSSMSVHILGSVIIAFLVSVIVNIKNINFITISKNLSINIILISSLVIFTVYLIPVKNILGGILLFTSSALLFLLVIIKINFYSFISSSILMIKKNRFIFYGLAAGYTLLGQKFGGIIGSFLFNIKSVTFGMFFYDEISYKYIPFVSISNRLLLWNENSNIFLLYFCLPFFIGIFGILFILIKSYKYKIYTNQNVILNSLLFNFIIFPLSFFSITFISIEPYSELAIWIRTRMLEIPFYGLLLFGIISFLSNINSKLYKNIALLFISFWALGPLMFLIYAGIYLEQLNNNLEYILSEILLFN